MVAAMRRAAVDFPFVPTTWTASRLRSGLPRRSSSVRMRPRPKPSVGHGESDSSQRTSAPASTADGIELPPVALELLPLGLDHLRRRPRDEPLVREHPLGALHLGAQPGALRLDVAVVAASRAPRLHDRVEDALLVALERRHHARAP